MRTYDFVAVGGGSAGFNGARLAASLGMKAAVVDGAKDLGGLCILRGCMPSKTLIYAAEVLHLARSGKAFGLRIPRAEADMRAVHGRKLRIIGEFAEDRLKHLTSGKFDLVRGYASFVDPHTVDVGGRRIRSRHFLIGTGSRVCVPPVPGLAGSAHWTSDDVLDLDFVPKSVIVLGGGVVACELAQFLARIGTRVCLIQRSPSLLRTHSPEAAAVVRRAFEDEGIEVLTETHLEAVEPGPRGFAVRFAQGGKRHVRRAEHLFNALGRYPDTSMLNLAAAGVHTTEGGRIVVNPWQQTSAAHIYAAGDCCGPHEIVHVAIQQAELAVRHLSGAPGLKPLDDATLLGVVFTDPQIGTIGWRECDLDARGIRHLSASYRFNDHGKSILMNATYGYVKVLADPRTGRILGAEIVGKDAGELIHVFSGPVAMGATVRDMLRAPWYHPTLAEIVTYPLEDIAGRLPAERKRRVTRAFRH